MLHSPGVRLGPYEIVSSAGVGGMGEVYKARDTRLERTVAIKVSKDSFEERFRNEALMVAALNHPHICTLFDVGPDYLVMEYVEGAALRGPLPVADVVRLAGQIADALEHAHSHGIIHRDLKPSNILLTKSGVKVLDFGLAKRQPIGPVTGESHPTLTEGGVVLGTPRYMAPEQIDGQKADERTDIFAFGLVLYELLTGQHAFEGKSAASVMAAILDREPTPISALKPTTPPALEQVVLTCLAKDPAERWQSVREMKHALAWAARPELASRTGKRRHWRAAALWGVVVLTVGSGLVLVRQRAKPAKPPPVRLQVGLPPGGRLLLMATLAVSPDGRQIAFDLGFLGKPPQVFLRELGSLTVSPVPGSERAGGAFWSPDGRHLAFSGAHGMQKVALSGGPAQTLCQCLPEHGATWSRGDVIVYSKLGRLLRVSATGGEPTPLGDLALGETGRFWPQFLPDGRHYIYLSLASRAEDQGIYVGALDSSLRKRVVATPHNAAYSPPGYLLFLKNESLVAQPFDAQRLEVTGEPFPVIGDEVARYSGTVFGGLAQFSVSANGVLAWRPGPPMDFKQLAWFDRSGRRMGTLGEPGPYSGQALSPDDKSVAVCRQESSSNRDIWLLEVATGTSRRLTFDPHDDCGPVWSPDGQRIAFFSDRRGVREIYQKRADGSGEDELLLASKDFPLHPEDWSADGRFLSYNSARPGHENDLFLLPVDRSLDPTPIAFLATEVTESFSTIAPNGRWIAYQAPGSGSPQVYVREVSPEGKAGPGQWQISSDRGFWPRWRADGKELFFFGMGRVMAVDVRPDGRTFEAGAPRPLGITLGDEGKSLEGRAREVGPLRVTRDGQRFLLSDRASPREPIRVLVNWLP
jgi:Tol biopolymer transport system component